MNFIKTINQSKKIKLAIIIALILIMAVIVLLLLLNKNADESSEQGIAVLVPGNASGWAGALPDAVESEAKRRDIKVTLELSNSVKEQSDQISLLASKGYKSILIYPESDAIAPAIEKAKEMGSKILLFEEDVPDVKVNRIYTDNNEAGEMGAKYIINKLGKNGGNVALMAPDDFDVAGKERFEAAKSILEKESNINLLGAWQALGAEAGLAHPSAMQLIEEQTQVDAVYCTNDDVALGTLIAFANEGRDDLKVVTGCGASEAYLRAMNDYPDIYACSINITPYNIGEAMEVALKLNKIDLVKKEKPIKLEIIDRENANEWLDKFFRE